jgi:hypothetical protein
LLLADGEAHLLLSGRCDPVERSFVLERLEPVGARVERERATGLVRLQFQFRTPGTPAPCSSVPRIRLLWRGHPGSSDGYRARSSRRLTAQNPETRSRFVYGTFFADEKRTDRATYPRR